MNLLYKNKLNMLLQLDSNVLPIMCLMLLFVYSEDEAFLLNLQENNSNLLSFKHIHPVHLYISRNFGHRRKPASSLVNIFRLVLGNKFHNSDTSRFDPSYG